MERCVFVETVAALHWSERSDYGVDAVWCRYFASRPLGSREWAPWANYDFDAPAAPAQ